MKIFLHILSNVTYGGGEQVLFNLCKEMPKNNVLFLLRKTNQVPKLKNINNNSFLVSKDVYSFKDYCLTIIYFFILIINLRFIKKKFDCIVLHGFPGQFMLVFFNILFPKKKKYMIYHQLKRKHSGLKSFIRFLEIIILCFTSPYIGAPSERSLNSVKNYIPKIFRKDLRFFLFKNCFMPIKFNYQSKKIYKKIDQLSNGKPYILTVARFEDFKGHMRLIKFIKNNIYLKDKLNFFFIGSGKNFEECKTYIKNNNIPNIFLIGSQPRNSLYLIYKNCLGVFIPSFEEAFGVAIVEAQSFKKPILVFEESLKLSINTYRIDEKKKDYNVKKFFELLKWDYRNEDTFVYSAFDTFKALENQINL